MSTDAIIARRASEIMSADLVHYSRLMTTIPVYVTHAANSIGVDPVDRPTIERTLAIGLADAL